MTQQACVVSQLTLEFPSKVMFKELDFSLEHHQVSALIGRNGQGKSLLMQLLQEISPTKEMHISGQITWLSKHAYLAQLTRLSSSTIAEALEIDHLYKALQRIEQGEAEFDDYDLLEGNLNIYKLTGENTPFSETPMFNSIDGKELKESMLDFFQYIVCIRDSKATEPLNDEYN